MLRSIVITLFVAATGAAVAEPAPTLKPASRSLRLTFTCDAADLPAGSKTVDLWIPIPPSDERQKVVLLNENSLAGGRFTEEKTFGNRLYYQRFDVADAAMPARVELIYDVEVREATVDAAKQLPPSTSEVPATGFEQYLCRTAMIPLDGPIADLEQKIKFTSNEPLRAAKTIYDHLVDSMVYNYLAKGAGKGNAVWACDSKTGDCTDYHSVFIGLCRRRGIPADHVFGLPLPPEKPEGTANHCHCWARFWVAGVGWVPIDASRADKFPTDREYYFGTLGSTWVTLAHGRDVVLEPPQQGPPLNMLHGPVAEVDGQPWEKLRWRVHYKNREDVAAR